MIAICPACRKNFDVLWPHLWRYKINRNYFCSWTCYRLKQKKRKKEEKVSEQAKKRPRMTRVEMATAMQIWRDDGDIDSYLKAHGIGNIQKWKKNQRARKPDEVPKPKTAGDAMAAMKDAADEFFGKCTEMGLNGGTYVETPEGNWMPAETPEPIKAQERIEFKIRGIEGQFGLFFFDHKHNRIDWTSPEGEEVSMDPAHWQMFIKQMPRVIEVLMAEGAK